MSLWSAPEVPKEMPCEKCGQMTPFNGLIRAGRVPCVHCGALRPHTPLRTGCWHLIMLGFFVGAIPVALIAGEGAIVVLFPLFLLLFLGMFLVFVIGCLICRWKGNLRSYLLSLLIGLLVAAGSLWALYPKGSGTKAWMIPALVVMALLFFGVLSRIRMLDQTDDPAGQEGKPGSTKSSSEQ